MLLAPEPSDDLDIAQIRLAMGPSLMDHVNR